MMKNSFIHNILALVLAMFFFVAGTGYNLVTYCCSTCAHEGISKVASCCGECKSNDKQQSDCGMHSDENAKSEVCNQMEHHKKSCEFKRLTLEVPTFQDFKFNFDLANSLVLFHFTSTYKIEPQENVNSYFFNPPNLCVLSSGREILTLHSTLLI